MGIETPSRSWQRQQEAWDIIDVLLGGTAAIRATGVKFLPQMTFEDPEDYKHRLNKATLYPAYAETVTAMCGRVFADPPIHSGVPEWIEKEVFTDTNLHKLQFESFLSKLFAKSFSHGHACVLVDAPEFSGTATVRQIRDLNLHPYYVILDAKQILGAKMDSSGLANVRIAMQEERPNPNDEWTTVLVDTIRSYTRIDGSVRMELYERKVKQDDGTSEWVLIPERTVTIGVPVIPLYTFYTGYLAPFESKPPLAELAYLNAKHYNLQSTYDELCHLAMIPILTLIGGEKDTVLRVGSKAAVRITNPDGELKYTEHTGAAMKTGREALDKLKEEMREAGAKLLLPQANNTNKTATQAAEEAQRENSPLSVIVADFASAVVQLLRGSMLWRSTAAATEPTFRLRPNLRPDFAPADSVTVLVNMADRNYLSPETLFAECQRRNLLSEQVGTWEQEKARLANSEDGYLIRSIEAKAASKADPANTDPNPEQNTVDNP